MEEMPFALKSELEGVVGPRKSVIHKYYRPLVHLHIYVHRKHGGEFAVPFSSYILFPVSGRFFRAEVCFVND